MIHDAYVEVTCDRFSCREAVPVALEWVYRNLDERSGHYDVSNKKIEASLRDCHDWIVTDGKHFCSPECQP